MTFDEAFTKLLGHEGGYSNHPSDPGGETNWGVTKKVAQANGYLGSMKEYPVFEAKLVYRASYWDACRCDELSDAVRFDVFDGAVNSGVGQSIKWLQRAVSATDDGVIGMKTLLACNALPGPTVQARYNGHRLEFMTNLKTWSAFGGGWARRIAHNLKAA